MVLSGAGEKTLNRLIEIAGVAHEDRLAARERYRFYKDAGYEIQHYNLDDEQPVS